MKFNNPFFGTIESEVTHTKYGFIFESPLNGGINMVFDPTDSDHSFKGQGNGWTYWLIRQQ